MFTVNSTKKRSNKSGKGKAKNLTGFLNLVIHTKKKTWYAGIPIGVAGNNKPYHQAMLKKAKKYQKKHADADTPEEAYYQISGDITIEPYKGKSKASRKKSYAMMTVTLEDKKGNKFKEVLMLHKKPEDPKLYWMRDIYKKPKLADKIKSVDLYVYVNGVKAKKESTGSW